MDKILHGQCQRCVIWCGGVTSHVSSEPNEKKQKPLELCEPKRQSSRVDGKFFFEKIEKNILLSSALETYPLGSYNPENERSAIVASSCVAVTEKNC